jgi:hypothetical protein
MNVFVASATRWIESDSPACWQMHVQHTSFIS